MDKQFIIHLLVDQAKQERQWMKKFHTEFMARYSKGQADAFMLSARVVKGWDTSARTVNRFRKAA